jgi:hypothetical protein
MRTSKTACRLAALAAIAAGLFQSGCSDVGDSSSYAGPSNPGDLQDATTSSEAPGSDDDAASDGAADAAQANGSNGTDMADGTASVDDTPLEPNDGAATEPELMPGSGTDEAGGQDSSVEKTGALGAGASDGGSPEGGHLDFGAPDSASADASVHDASSTPDAGVGGVADSGGLDAGVPCLTPDQTNCVQCTGSLNPPICTATEALIVARDIARGNLTSAGQLNPNTAADQGSCYTCLNAKACLDDNAQDTGNECADTPDLTGAAAGSGVTQCLATLACILTSDCEGPGGIAGTSAVASQENVQLCYCGGDHAGSVCSTAGAATDGVCVTQEATGFGFPYSDNKEILANYGSQVYPSGSANAMFQCAASNHCTICQ